MKNLIQKAVNICGSQKKLADKCGVKPQSLNAWVHGDIKKIPLERAYQIQNATNGQVTAREIRPDLPDYMFN
jgi:DNA-binding transcriptional regulator YdaS (Cro superfamily)